MPLVLLGGMRGEIGAHLLLEARLHEIAAGDRHGAAVDLDHEVAARAVGKQRPNTRSGTSPRSRTMPRCDTFTFKANGLRAVRARSGRAAMISSGWMRRMSARPRTACCKRDVEIHNVKLVLDERAAGLAVLAAPFDIGEVDAVALDQEAGAAVGERIDDRRRAGGRVVVELGAGAVDVAGMEEARQAIVGAVERAADQGGNVGGAQEPVPRELAHDLHVVIGEAEGRRFRRTAEPRQSGWRATTAASIPKLYRRPGAASRQRAVGWGKRHRARLAVACRGWSRPAARGRHGTRHGRHRGVA